MQTTGRATRLVALSTCYERFHAAAMNPFLSMRERQQMIDQTATLLHRILDEEYSQGYRDGGNFATFTVEKILKER